jgi:hypothetical protein
MMTASRWSVGLALACCCILGVTHRAAEPGDRLSTPAGSRPLPDPPAALRPALAPPAEFAGDLGAFRPVLRFEDGRLVRTAAEWGERRSEIRGYWHRVMGPWPPLIARPKLEVLASESRESFLQKRVRLELDAGQASKPGCSCLPAEDRSAPCSLFYGETSTGLGKAGRDFAYQLTLRGWSPLRLIAGRGCLETGSGRGHVSAAFLSGLSGGERLNAS